MSSLPTFSEMPNLERQDSSPASASSLDHPTPAPGTTFHSHAIPQTVPNISIPTLPNTLLPGNMPMSVPNLPSTDMYGWLPSPASSVFNFQPTFPSLDPTSSALGFSAVSSFPSFGYNYLPQNLTHHATAHHRSRSHCNPADIFGMTPGSASTNLGFDLEMTDGTSLENSTNIASPCSSVESSSSDPSSEDKAALKKEKKNVPTKIILSMTSKTAPVPLVFGEDDASGDAGDGGDAPGPKKRSRTAQACERCRIRKARCFGGNPCNRCIKRKFVCEFTPTRQRGPNKPRSPELPVHSSLLNAPSAGATGAKAKARRHSMHAVSTSSALNTSISGRYAPIRSRPPPAIPEAAPTIGLGLELTPPRDEDAGASSTVAPPRKLSAAAIRQAAELERLTGGFKASSLLLGTPTTPAAAAAVAAAAAAAHAHAQAQAQGHHAHGHGHGQAHAHSASGSGSTASASASASVIGSGWTMIGGGDLGGSSTSWAEDDLFRFSPESSSAGGQTGMDEFSSNFEFPWTPNSPQSMAQSFAASTSSAGGAFELAQSELLNLRDDALRQLYGSVPLANDSEWFTAY